MRRPFFHEKVVMGMYVDAQVVIGAAALLGAVTAIIGGLFAVYRKSRTRT